MMAVQQLIRTVCVVCVLLSRCLSDPCPCEDHTLCQPITTTPKKEIFVFSNTNSPEVWTKYNWSIVTTVVMFSGLHDQLMCYAHKHGARVVVMVDYGPIPALANSTARQIWVKQKTQLVQQHYLDGINIDFEDILFEWQKSYRDGYTALVQETKNSLRSLNPHAQITVDVGHVPNVFERNYDYVALSQITDFMLLMCYDELAHVLTGGPNSPFPTTKQGIESYLKLPHGNSSKLVIAMPWYGFDFTCSKIVLNNVCLEVSEKCKKLLHLPTRLHGFNDGVEVDYRRIVQYLKNNSTTGRRWDEASQTPYFNYKNSGDNSTHQVWYDDHQSLVLKLSLVNEYNLRGAGMWYADAIDYSDTPEGEQQRRDMWEPLADIVN